MERSTADLAAVSAVVERSGDAAGLVPEDLAPLLDRLPPAGAERIRNGSIRYHPSADRRTFELTGTPGAQP